MERVEKPVRISGHARQQLRFRGATEEDVVEAIRSEDWQTAELGRMECRKEYSFNADWNGKYYSKRQVRPIFVDEPDQIVVVTVYVYYS